MCNPDDFVCKNGQCINYNKKCDGLFDCRDASDEMNCRSKNCIQYLIFINLTCKKP